MANPGAPARSRRGKPPFDEGDALRSLGKGLFTVDRDLRPVSANPSAARILGLESPPGQTPPELLPLLRDCLEEERRTSRVLEAGERRLAAQAWPIVRDGAIVGAALLLDDALPEGSLPVPEIQLRAVLDSVSEGIWICDGSGVILDINRESQRLNSVEASDYVGRSIRCILDEGLVDHSVTLDVLRHRRQSSIIQRITKTGKQLLVTGSPVFGPDGTIAMVVVNERDVTELNALREGLQNARKVEERYRHEIAELSMLELRQKDVVAESPSMRHCLHALLKLAHMDASRILILGESGTGKGLLAKFVHQHSPRAKKPFIPINCPAVPENLFEAELFGYEKGAFTGALKQGKAGLIELARGGTLFLDEVGDIPLSVQAKLLKYLDDHELRRLGGAESKVVECGVVAATNCDLERLVDQKRFRKDLFFRLNTFIVRIAPLRERREDIFGLAEFYLAACNARYAKAKRLTPKAMRLLEAHDYPGNVRELVGIIQKAFVMSEGDDLTEAVQEALGPGGGALGEAQPRGLAESADQASARALRQAAARCRTTREMATLLGVSQSTVVRKLARYGIKPGRFISES
ncbi:DNA-binding transcriptional activator HyfR [Fundidesulfovibrio magnetotacticus]|uniref:HTH-type transcriptional regulatory protein TyrR n=1 Tax=Fundidesulfovibrio magnetotacticus TaxID=2730080 RepID=A0A6V8M661_9BACT|nr:sigma 54-interacting transcriptional regulator [Fundidesulfovibrio magnetotacticus]GFK96105.1 DNA-binding transcriptional activator HyfR [Fundidesulfovibrio magnetotacticus]